MSCQCRPDGDSATPPQSQHLRNLRNLWSFLSRFIVRRVCLLCLPRRGAWWECTARWCGARVSTLALVAGLRATDQWVLQRCGEIFTNVFSPAFSPARFQAIQKFGKLFMFSMVYLDFKKSILAMFCSIDEKTAAESHFSISKNEALPIGLWPVLQLTRPPLLWNSIWLEPLSALLRDLADTSA